jgi:ABC-type Fe3+-siderophore transport system permease subunit
VIGSLASGHADAATAREQLVLIDIRLPRLLLGAFGGAALAVAGAMMQGMFRNPLADPGLIGVSSGAALAALATIALGKSCRALTKAFASVRCPSPPSAAATAAAWCCWWPARAGSPPARCCWPASRSAPSQPR